MIQGPWLAMINTFKGGWIWLKWLYFLAGDKLTGNDLLRKMIHLGTGSKSFITRLLFTDHSISKFVVSFFPFVILPRFILVGLEKRKDRNSVGSITRTGRRNELQKGPLIHGVVFMIFTIVYWKLTNAIIPTMILGDGEGFSDLIGRKFPYNKMAWNKEKTLTGSLTILINGAAFSIMLNLMVNRILSCHQSNSYFLPKDLINFIRRNTRRTEQSFRFRQFDSSCIAADNVLVNPVMRGSYDY